MLEEKNSATTDKLVAMLTVIFVPSTFVAVGVSILLREVGKLIVTDDFDDATVRLERTLWPGDCSWETMDLLCYRHPNHHYNPYSHFLLAQHPAKDSN